MPGPLQAKYRKLVALETTDTSTKQLHVAGAIQLHSSNGAQKSEYKKEREAERLEKNLTNGFIRACAVPTIR